MEVGKERLVRKGGSWFFEVNLSSGRMTGGHASSRVSPYLHAGDWLSLPPEQSRPVPSLPVDLAAGPHRDLSPWVAGVLPISKEAFHKTFYCISLLPLLSFGYKLLT